MADNNLILDHLRAIRATQGEHSKRFDRIEHRLLSLEQQVSGLRSDFVFQQHEHVDLEQRVERIERRLELSDS